jgi:hypothetical protein
MQYIPRDGGACPTAGKVTCTLLRIEEAVKLSHQSRRRSCRGDEYRPVDGIVSGRANLWRRPQSVPAYLRRVTTSHPPYNVHLEVCVLVVLLVEILDESVPKVGLGGLAPAARVLVGSECRSSSSVCSRRVDACIPLGGRRSRAEEDDVARARRKGSIFQHKL